MIKTILFDLDGTLLNTIDDLADAANWVCTQHGWPTFPVETYKHFVGNGIPKLVERFSPASCRSPEQLAATLAEFDKVYGAHMHDKTAPYPGMPALLARLKAEGARMCICSNTWSAQCRTVLTRLGIDEYFDFYVEAQGALHKSRPDVFFQTLTRLGGTDPDRCVVCEDSLYAARTAHDAGFHVIGIADAASKSDEPALREVSDQFLTDWTELDWDKV